MSKRRVYSEETLAIMDRYFSAVEQCRLSGRLKSVSDYCKNNDIVMNHFYLQRKDRNRGFFELSWLSSLVRQCGVSSKWLITGDGGMIVDR